MSARQALHIAAVALLCALSAHHQPAGATGGEADPGSETFGWTTFHGGPRRTGISSVNLTAPPFAHLWTFDLGQHTWKYCQGASVWSACAVAGTVDRVVRVFIGAYDHNIYCIDARTGSEAWRFTTGCIVNAAPTFARIGHRPMLFVSSMDRTFYGLDARTGKKVWSFETQPWTYTVGESVAGSAIIATVAGRKVMLATMWNGDRRPLRTVQSGEIFAFEPATGALLWRHELTSANLTSPALMDVNGTDMLFVGSEDGALYACNAETGELQWKQTTGHRIAATPVCVKVDGKPVVIIANGFGMVRCVSAADGAPIWKYKTGHEALSTAAVMSVDGKWVVFVGSSDRCLHSIQFRTTRTAWKFQTGKHVVSSPAVARVRGRPMVFFNSLDNALYGLDWEQGCEIMRFEAGDMLWPYETRGQSVWSSPSIVEIDPETHLLLYPAHDGKLYAFTDNQKAASGSTNAVVSSFSVDPSSRASSAPPPNKIVLYVPPTIAILLIIAGALPLLKRPRSSTAQA